ncbi:MAG: lysozyme [Gammaproteobacteria bacterium]|nr:lysozyme [Gammaproteobacteria bacterium]
MPLAALALSGAALVGVANHEGFRGAAYKDPVGVPTIGFGTTQGVKMGDKITPERALVRLLADADAMQKQMRACIGDVPLHQHEWDAFVSLTYNIGSAAFCRSSLVQRLKQQDYAGACRAILPWNKAGGRVLAGLTKRRQAEFALCAKGGR